MTARRLFVPALLAVAPACVHWDLARNAPGHVDLAQPPARLDGRPELPADPGERAFVVSAGPVLSVGLIHRAGPDTRLGGEVSLDFGWEPSRHSGFLRDSGTFGPIYHRQAVGLDLGATFLESREPSGWRDLSAELHVRRVITYAAGGFYDPASGHPGVLATVSLAGLFLRVQERFDGAGQIMVGLAFKPQMAWVWGR